MWLRSLLTSLCCRKKKLRLLLLQAVACIRCVLTAGVKHERAVEVFVFFSCACVIGLRRRRQAYLVSKTLEASAN